MSAVSELAKLRHEHAQVLARIATLEAERASCGLVAIVFDGPPGPDSGRFVEVEDESGASIKLGEWEESKDGFWRLWISALRGEGEKPDATE